MSDDVKQDSAMWSAVDQSGAGAALADYLTRATAVAQDYKRGSFAALHLKPGDRVLEVGCGAGSDVRALAQLVGKSGRALGLDFSEDLLAHARQESSAATQSTTIMETLLRCHSRTLHLMPVGPIGSCNTWSIRPRLWPRCCG
jgi:SAM-dependent methyltransferase